MRPLAYIASLLLGSTPFFFVNRSADFDNSFVFLPSAPALQHRHPGGRAHRVWRKRRAAGKAA